ncbi:GTP cyclohydrolase II [Helicocarpus griseus UAMH5409]|uniref:GTP cyclohydrolase II n=1 Tax=Helicocarpus griseus UAMH5409 TaxID=1447875 RepID=A0A2B7Y1B0_9EURO|nr:GTP cyclohydrolase II [Helicocarpus griseus UAMH5409]
MPEFPSHASPYFSPQPLHPRHPALDNYSLAASHSNDAGPTSSPSSHTCEQSPGSSAVSSQHPQLHPQPQPQSPHHLAVSQASTPALPDSLISPSFTPPSTPHGLATAYLPTAQTTISTTESRDRLIHAKPPKLLPRLPQVECVVRARIPTTTGAEMFLHLYQNDVDNKEHLAIVFGNAIRSRSLDRVRQGETEMDRMIRGAYVGRLWPGRQHSRIDGDKSVEKGKDVAGGKTEAGSNDAADAERTVEQQPAATQSQTPQQQGPLVRIHSECYTGETAWSARCDCGEQLDEAARLMSEAAASDEHNPGGVIIYLRQEGRGIGLSEKLKAYNLQDLGNDTVEANLILRHPADARSYGLATAMLVDLGLGADSEYGGIRLLTNNPDKVMAVEGPNREVVVEERVPMIPLAWRTGGERGIRSTEIEGYLRTKIGKMGHMLQ